MTTTFITQSDQEAADLREWGAHMRRLRKRNLLSQRDLAQKAGITHSTVYLLEAGRTRPRLVVLRSLFKALRLDGQPIEALIPERFHKWLLP